MSLLASSSRVAVSARSSAQRSALRPALSSRVSRPAMIAQPRHIVRAEPEATSPDFEKIWKDVQTKWDAIDNKTAVVGYGVGAIVAVWLSSTLIGAVNNVPILPKFLELIGLGYSAWFTYRYLLFKSSREELVKDITEVKKKISGESDA